MVARFKVPVSVVIPCYRCKETIMRAVQSVSAQTFMPEQVILVDDFSDDGTLLMLYEIQLEMGVDWIRVVPLELNGGAAAARNAGWNSATGKYVAFLDADDTWHPQKIEVQYKWMEAHPEVGLTGHAHRDGHLGVQSTYLLSNLPDFKPVSLNKLLMANRFSTPTVMLRKDIENRFPKNKRYSEDYHLWLEICAAGVPCYRSELPLTMLYKPPYGSSGLSASMMKMELGELHGYLNLYRHRKVGIRIFLFMAYSLLKFVRRLFFVMLWPFIRDPLSSWLKKTV